MGSHENHIVTKTNQIFTTPTCSIMLMLLLHNFICHKMWPKNYEGSFYYEMYVKMFFYDVIWPTPRGKIRALLSPDTWCVHFVYWCGMLYNTTWVLSSVHITVYTVTQEVHYCCITVQCPPVVHFIVFCSTVHIVYMALCSDVFVYTWPVQMCCTHTSMFVNRLSASVNSHRLMYQ